MLRPNAITIYNKYDDKYYKTVLDNVYWYGTESINISGKGFAESNAINIIIDGDNLSGYVDEKDYTGKSDTYTIKRGDRILYGTGEDIESLSELNDKKQITVFSYDTNIIGSAIDNILVSGK